MYASNTDIAAEFKGGITWNSQTFQASQIDTWCGRASNFINGRIGGKYQTPVDPTASPISYSIVQEICINLVVARVVNRTRIQTGEQKQTQTMASTDYHKLAMQTLDDISSGKMLLPDAVLATSTDGADSYVTDNLADIPAPEFTREGDDW